MCGKSVADFGGTRLLSVKLLITSLPSRDDCGEDSLDDSSYEGRTVGVMWLAVVLVGYPCCAKDAVHCIVPSNLCLARKSWLDPLVVSSWCVVLDVFDQIGSDGVFYPVGCLMFATGAF